MKRSAIKRKPVRRDWTAARYKTEYEGKCRGCGRTVSDLRRIGRRLEAAHLVGRTYDLRLESGVRFVHALSVVPLCGPPTDTGTCHNLYDSRKLDLWDKLTDAERGWAVSRIGSGPARARIEGKGERSNEGL